MRYVDYSDKRSFFGRFKDILMSREILLSISKGIDYFKHKIIPVRKFIFGDRVYKCFWSWRNSTWHNNREVELSLSKEFLSKNAGKKVLEVGNVLNHYFKSDRVVVDKYENWEGIINEDIATFSSKENFDSIISISTIEHIGFDEVPSEPEKVIPAIKNIYSLLKKGGIFFFTIPWNHNNYLKKLILDNKIKVDEKSFLIRDKKKIWHNVKYNNFLKKEKDIMKSVEPRFVLFIGKIKK